MNSKNEEIGLEGGTGTSFIFCYLLEILTKYNNKQSVFIMLSFIQNFDKIRFEQNIYLRKRHTSCYGKFASL